ncbi:hypothetical protein ACFYMO_31585 [Streptomyces sp. NPDC007025]|uniref:hypothetical protein n=1 Tax=Streptomyces sp. NPDC007025 TaxID=3364771 RepID=UPI003675F6E5
MNFSMSITPPSKHFSLTPEFELSIDYDSLVMETCDLLSQTDCTFQISGFGQESWPVDISYDLSSVIEQLPDTLAALRANEEAIIDLYGQGIERELSFTPRGEHVTVHCSSRTQWQPNPTEEHVSHHEVQHLLTNLAREFKEALEIASPVLAETSPFTHW